MYGVVDTMDYSVERVSLKVIKALAKNIEMLGYDTNTNEVTFASFHDIVGMQTAFEVMRGDIANVDVHSIEDAKLRLGVLFPGRIRYKLDKQDYVECNIRVVDGKGAKDVRVPWGAVKANVRGSCRSLYYPDTVYLGTVSRNFSDTFSRSPSCRTIRLPNTAKAIPHEMFCNNTSLESVTDGANVDNIGSGAFKFCSSLVDFDFNNICSIGSYAFYDTGFKTLKFGSNLRSVQTEAFGNCISLEYVEFDANSNLHIGDDVFESCSSLREVKLPNTIEKLDRKAFKRSGIIKMWMPDSLRVIAEACFKDCERLNRVHFSNNLDVIGRQAFDNCNHLESVELMNTKVSRLGTRAFANCKRLYYVDLRTPALTVISPETFAYGGLTTIKLGHGLKRIEIAAFANTQIEEIHIPDTVTVISNSAFYQCEKLRTIKFECDEEMGRARFEPLLTTLANELPDVTVLWDVPLE